MTIEGKTIFDFTTDKKLIAKFIEYAGVNTEEELKSKIAKYGNAYNQNMLLKLAWLTNNKELASAVDSSIRKQVQKTCDDNKDSDVFIG